MKKPTTEQSQNQEHISVLRQRRKDNVERKAAMQIRVAKHVKQQKYVRQGKDDTQGVLRFTHGMLRLEMEASFAATVP